jgi:hypothetical protein
LPALPALLTAALALAACRGIIGYKDITLESSEREGGPSLPDGALPPRDAGVDAPSCTSGSPVVLFNTQQLIETLIVSSTWVYGELPNDIYLDAGITAPAFVGEYSGLIGCEKSGCNMVPVTVSDLSGFPPRSSFGSAAPNEAGLYYAFQKPLVDGSAPGILETSNAAGKQVAVLGADDDFPLYVAVDDSWFYWIDDPTVSTNGNSPKPWSVRVAQIGANPFTSTQFFSGFGPDYPTFQIFLDSVNVYALAGDGASGGEFIGLFSCPRLVADGGGGCQGMATEIVSRISYDSEGYGPTDSFAADGEYVYQAGSVSSTITRTALADHTQKVLAANLSSPAFIVVAGSQLYWASPSGIIYRMAKDGSEPPVPFVCSLSNVGALAADNERLYFVGPAAKSSEGYEIASVALF